MSSILNEIAAFLARPIPLGLMLVFFFVSLAVFSLFLGRVESRNREVQSRYLEQIYALTQQRGQSWAGGGYEPVRVSGSGGGWLGLLTVLALVVGGGVVVHNSQSSPSSELVVPELAGLGAKAPVFTSVKPAPALVQASAVAPAPEPAPKPEPAKPEPVAAPVPSMQTPPEPAKAPAAPVQPAATLRTKAQKAPGPDQDIERMLARERRRAARRRQGRRGSSDDGWELERPRNRRGSRASSQRTTPVQKREPAPSPKAAERTDELLPPSSLPKKRRRRLKLDRSNDPLGSL